MRHASERPTRGAVCRPCWAAIVPLHPAALPPVRRSLCQSWRVAQRATTRDVRAAVITPVRVSSARAVGPYDGSLRAILHALKYDGRPSLARPLARLMAASAPATSSPESTWSVPVPLHRRRRRARGFNQAEELARHLGLRWTGVAAPDAARPPSQTDLPASARRANVRDAFAVRRAEHGQRAEGAAGGRRLDHRRDAGSVCPGAAAGGRGGGSCPYSRASRVETALRTSACTSSRRALAVQPQPCGGGGRLAMVALAHPRQQREIALVPVAAGRLALGSGLRRDVEQDAEIGRRQVSAGFQRATRYRGPAPRRRRPTTRCSGRTPPSSPQPGHASISGFLSCRLAT